MDYKASKFMVGDWCHIYPSCKGFEVLAICKLSRIVQAKG